MSGKFDATVKHLLSVRLADWKPLLGVPKKLRVRAIDADLSYVTSVADKVLRVEDIPPWILHAEPHAWRDVLFDLRMFHYHATVRKLFNLSVHSSAVILHRSAWCPENRGFLDDRSPLPGCSIRFEYEVIKIWERPVETFLEGGVGLLPFAPLANVSRRELPAVVDRMTERLLSEVPLAEAAELSTATFLLMGLEYSDEESYRYLRSLRPIMQHSSTYQALIDEGIEKGMHTGLTTGRRDTLLLLGTRRFGKPSPRVRKRIEAITDSDLLDTLALRLFEATSWKDLLADL